MIEAELSDQSCIFGLQKFIVQLCSEFEVYHNQLLNLLLQVSKQEAPILHRTLTPGSSLETTPPFLWRLIVPHVSVET